MIDVFSTGYLCLRATTLVIKKRVMSTTDAGITKKREKSINESEVVVRRVAVVAPRWKQLL